MNRGAIPLLYKQWTPELESELQAMKENYIKIEDTAFPRSVVMNKMVLSAAADHYTREEINALMEKLSLIDADDGATASVG